ncbi:MAG TPA: chemotaxis response regulator protein-glutamate methylesterase [Coriobacteriia bacterium]
MLAPIRVLVVDDSALIRQMVTHALVLDPRIEVVGVAKNGAEAVEKVRQLKPDVVTLDIEMPELTGLEALPFIIRDSAARVLMLSSVDDPDTTYAALSGGAVDFIAKPKGGFASSLTDLSELLIKKIKTAYRIDPEKRGQITGGLSPVEAAQARVGAGVRRSGAAGIVEHLVVMAASTGGPPALETVFAGLSDELPVAYLVVQHLPVGFTMSLAKRLSRISGCEVAEAQDGMRLEPGQGYVAPAGTHMTVSGRPGRTSTLVLDDSPPLHGVRPSADPLFASAAYAYGSSVTGVVLTGMGQDGAEGLAAVRKAGGRTLVQDEATSVVWGMPGAAVRLGGAQAMVPIDRVAAEIRRSVREGS